MWNIEIISNGVEMGFTAHAQSRCMHRRIKKSQIINLVKSAWYAAYIQDGLVYKIVDLDNRLTAVFQNDRFYAEDDLWQHINVITAYHGINVIRKSRNDILLIVKGGKGYYKSSKIFDDDLKAVFDDIVYRDYPPYEQYTSMDFDQMLMSAIYKTHKQLLSSIGTGVSLTALNA